MIYSKKSTLFLLNNREYVFKKNTDEYMLIWLIDMAK